MNLLAENINTEIYEDVRFMTMSSLCFYGFLRISECCDLLKEDVFIDEVGRLNIKIKVSKTDQNGQSVVVYVYES